MSERTVTDHPTRIDLQIGVSKITVKDVDLGKDGGNYTCEVTDHLMKRSSNQIFIDILGECQIERISEQLLVKTRNDF